MTSIYRTITDAAGLNPETADRDLHQRHASDAAAFGAHEYSARMAAVRTAVTSAFSAAGITANALEVEHAVYVAYYDASGSAALAPLAAETIAAAVKKAAAA